MVLLKAFNPHEIPAGTILGVATGREDPLGRILTIVRDNLNAPTPQHVIVCAPRGYGKSFFLRYVQVKLGQLATIENLPIAMALLPEELPHVKEPETLLAEIRRTFLGQPADTIGVSWLEDDGHVWDQQVGRLDAAIADRFKDTPGLLVAAVENFDLLLKKAFAKPVQATRLRELLARRGNRLMLIAASARGAFDRDYDLPLFKAFEEISFEPWTMEQSIEFFRAQRAAAGKAPLTDTQEARAKAVATFIGGTPRLATLIGEALLEDDPLRAGELLEKLVDELTPYYKERIEVLPARSQALLDALLRGGENCSATELARRVGAPSQPAIAAALDELKKDLLVTGDKAPDSAEVLLRVTDRVFAHYYRKRILSHGLETCPLEALVDLLAVIYSPEEKKREAAKFTALGFAREAQVFEKLWSADQSRLEKRSVDERVSNVSTEYGELIEAWDRVTDDRRFSDGLEILDRALGVATAANDTQAESEALEHRAWTLSALGRFDEALAAARDAATKAESAGDISLQGWVLGRVASIFVELGRLDEALVTAREALAKAESAGDILEQSEALGLVASILSELGRLDDALMSAREAAAKAESGRDVSCQIEALELLVSILGKLKRFEDALATAREAAAMAESAADISGQVRALLWAAWNLDALERFDEALTASRQAAVIAESSGLMLVEASALGSAASALGRLGRYPEALAAARQAAVKAERAEDIREQADALRLIAESLYQLGQHDEAITTLRQATVMADKLPDRELFNLIARAALVLRSAAMDVDLAYRSYESLTRNAGASGWEDLSLYFDDIAYVATRFSNWPRLIALLKDRSDAAEVITRTSDGLGEPGSVAANAFLDGGRDDALKMIRHIVPALDQAIKSASDQRFAWLWTAVLDASAENIATDVDDGAFLNEVAEIFAAYSSVPVRATSLLKAAADYHTAERDPAALARLDPDLATTLMAVFPPKAGRKKERRPRERKRRTSRTKR